MVPQGWLALGTVVRTRGNKGEVIVHLLTNSVERFLEVGKVAVFAAPDQKRELHVEQAWDHQGSAVVRFREVTSITEAEVLRGQDLVIPREQRRQPGEDEVFFSDLIGCDIFRPSGELLATVRDVYEDADRVWLAASSEQVAGEILIPWERAYFPSIDVEKRRLVAELPEGLLEANQS
jgi:16S rRNA processing protein RimM